MKTELVILKREHLHLMGEADAMQNQLRMIGPGLCLLADGEPVAAGGIMRLWDDVGKAWSVHTQRAVDSPFLMRQIHKHAKTQVPLLRQGMRLVRLEAETPAEPKYCSWLSALGFIFEGRMAKYRAGRDFVRFAWIAGGEKNEPSFI
jgi:hypothetical protein